MPRFNAFGQSIRDDAPELPGDYEGDSPSDNTQAQVIMQIRDEANALGAPAEFFEMLARCYDNIDDDNDYDLDIG